MRLEPIPPQELTEAQQPLDKAIRNALRTALRGFTAEREDGALVGPFAAFLHFPDLFSIAMGAPGPPRQPTVLAPTVREVVILTVGARFRAAYELYAHSRVGRDAGLSDAVVADLVAGRRPDALSEQEGVAHDVARALADGGVLPADAYRAAQAALGDRGIAELVRLAGDYALVSMVLNAYDVPVPDDGS